MRRCRQADHPVLERSDTGIGTRAIPGRGPTRARRRRSLAVAALLSVAAGGGSCGDDGGSDDPTPSSTTATTADATTTTTLTPEQEVEEAYNAYWEMGARLLEAPDPDDPEIARRTEGAARGALVDGLATLKAAGRYVEFGPLYEQQILSVAINDGTAAVHACVTDDAQVVDASGSVLDDGITTVDLAIELERRDGEWLVTQVVEEHVQDGVVECG